MSSLDVNGDIHSCSKPIRKRKRSAIIGDPAKVRHVQKLRQCKKGASSPVVKLAYPTGCLHPREIRPNRDPRHVTLSVNCVCLDDSISADWAKRALSSFNKKLRAQKEPEYELVEALQFIEFPGFQAIYHSNFVARPKNGREELFLAEVRRESKRQDPVGAAVMIGIQVASNILGTWMDSSHMLVNLIWLEVDEHLGFYQL